MSRSRRRNQRLNTRQKEEASPKSNGSESLLQESVEVSTETESVSDNTDVIENQESNDVNSIHAQCC